MNVFRYPNKNIEMLGILDKLQFRNSFFHVKYKYFTSGETAEKV